MANDTSCAAMGVEMELPLSVRNPQIPRESWELSFDAYAAASKVSHERSFRVAY